MLWLKPRSSIARLAGPALALMLATLLAGCFEPLYGERSLAGGPGLRQRLGSVQVSPIAAPSASVEARIAVELRNALIFELTGGDGAAKKKKRAKQ